MDVPVEDDEQIAVTPGESTPVEDQQPVEQPPVEPPPEAQPPTPEQERREDDRLSAIVRRVEALTRAIEKYPDAPANYVLRGEAILEVGDYELAARDFRKGLELADAQAETANWGFVYRALADRAREGLRYCQQANDLSSTGV